MKTIGRLPPHVSRFTHHASRFTFHAPRLTLLAILLLAASLRFYRLDAQSFWNDEGNSARIAERTLDGIVEGAAGDIHPPGYYLLLHYWRALFGQSEFALRAFSVAAGLALVVFTYLLGRRLFSEATGLAAAFLSAISPFAVYYSQEARMYALLGALSAASTYFLVRFLATGRSANRRIGESPIPAPRAIGTPVAYILTGAAGLYVQYTFAFVLLVHNGVFALWWLAAGRRSARRWRRLAAWAGVQVAVVVLYLPWLSTALRSATGWSSAGQEYELGRALLDVLRVLGVGITLPVEEAWAALAAVGALLLAGLWPRRNDRGGWPGITITAIYLLLPISLVFAFDLYKEAWLKFLVVVLPPFHVLVGHGVANLRIGKLQIGKSQICGLRYLFSILALIFVTVTVYPSLHNLYFDPAYRRDDYRQIAADIAASADPGTAIVFNAPNQWEVFTYYYPNRDVYPVPYRPSPDEVEAYLSPLVERYRRLFVLYWGDAESDPQRLVEAWLAAHAYKADDRWYGRVRLATYGVAPLPEEPGDVLDARFGEPIGLQGCTLGEGPFAPGDVLPVTLFWQARAPIAEPYKVTVQLLDGAGQLVAQHDGEPVGGFTPTSAWQPGQAVTDRHGVLLPVDLPPGRYTLVVAMYYAYTGERLPVTIAGGSAGDHLVLRDVEIVPPQ